jgi:hypothetical protein
LKRERYVNVYDLAKVPTGGEVARHRGWIGKPVPAILTFAVDVSASGFSINTVGIILMIVGALGLVWSLLFGAASRRIGGAGTADVPVGIVGAGGGSAAGRAPWWGRSRRPDLGA